MANATIQPSVLTRPADTNVYANGVGFASVTTQAALQKITAFASGANGTAILIGFKLATSQKACQGQIRVHFYNKAGISNSGIISDNAVFTLLTADKAFYQGYVDLQAFNTEDTSSTFAYCDDGFQGGLFKAMQGDSVDGSLWYQYEIKTGFFTPDSAQTFTATVNVIQ